MLSIVIPVYNVAPYLRECLSSVVKATEQVEKRGGGGQWNVEIICVDDGSTDGCGEILDEYASRFNPSTLRPSNSETFQPFNLLTFRVIHQENAGVSAARNAALDVARGEWLWFVDGDDSVEPEALSIFAAKADKADVVFFGCVTARSDGFKQGYFLPDWAPKPVSEESSPMIESLALGGVGDVFGWTWNKFFRREVVERTHIRFDRDVSFFEDELFTLEIMDVARTFATLPDCLYRYRQTDGGLTARGATTDLYAIGGAFLRIGAMLKNSGLRKIAYVRAGKLLRQAAYGKLHVKAARSLIGCHRAAAGLIGMRGGYDRMLRMLVRIPEWISVPLLAAFHLLHR